MDKLQFFPHLAWFFWIAIALLAVAAISELVARWASRKQKALTDAYNAKKISHSEFQKSYRLGDVREGFSILAVTAVIIGAVWSLVTLLSFQPYDNKYHTFYSLSGTVESIDNVFEVDGGDVTSSPVVKISGFDQPVNVADSRILTLEGESVGLICTYAWNPHAQDEINCGLAEGSWK